MSVNHTRRGFIITSFSILAFLFSCSDNSTGSEDIDLPIGSWEISEMTTVYEGETETWIKSQLEEMGLVWNYIFKDDYTVELTTNISGTLVNMPGTWSVSGQKLTLVLEGPSGSTGILEFDYSIKNDILKLNWQLPDGPEYFAEFKKLNKEK